MPWGASQLKPQQLSTLQSLVTKHLADPSLADFASSDDFAVTSTERGLNHWEQAHLVAALDVLNAYQSSRRARAACQVAGYFPGRQRHFTNDPRTRAVEFLKRWLRTRAGDKNVGEDEVRGICGFCRDVLNHPQLFPARNPRSFMRTISEVYEHLQWQLREVLEHDRTCAELTHRILSVSRNFVSDVVCYLLLAPTDLRQTDALPSLEVVALWQSLPDEGHPLPGRVDATLQHTMRDAWRTQCGSLIAAVLGTPWCVSLFKGVGSEEEASSHARGKAIKDGKDGPLGESAEQAPTGSRESQRISEVRRQFELGELRNSGLAGAFRTPAQSAARLRYAEVVQEVFDFVYLLGEVLVQFHRVSDGLGDYGMIRVAPWLHPFLETLVDKVQRIKGGLEKLNEAVDAVYVLARARGVRVEKPSPTSQMSARAHAAVERAVTGRSNHAQALLQTMEELRARSSPDRLPHVIEGLGDACMALQTVLASPEFRAHVGGAFPDLPALGGVPSVEVTAAGGWAVEGRPAAPLALTSEAADAGGWAIEARPAAPLALTSEASSTTACSSGTPPEGGRTASASTCSTPPVAEAVAVVTAAGLSKALPVAVAVGRPAAPRPEVPSAELRVREQGGELHADVFRVVTGGCTGTLKRHDQRSLVLSNGCLSVFAKGSRAKVKTQVEVASGVQHCSLEPGGILRLVLHRLPQGASIEDGVSECKHYAFEFPDVQLAAAFHSELTRGQPLGRR